MSKLAFKVIAGSGGMVCGGLIVDTTTHTHSFYPAGTNNKLVAIGDRTYNHTPIDRVGNYKGLRLVRLM